jgi:uncharacterized phage protein (TIGR01671 family)
MSPSNLFFILFYNPAAYPFLCSTANKNQPTISGRTNNFPGFWHTKAGVMTMEMPAFRVWHQTKDSFDPKTGQWTFVWRMSAVQILNVTAREVTIESKYGYANRLFRVGDSCILMQAVGVRDKNGNPVYTGDIVRVKDRDGRTNTGVVTDEGPMRVIRTDTETLTDWNNYETEVTGNIYQNSHNN